MSMDTIGRGRRVSISAFIARKIAGNERLDEEQLDGLDEFEVYMYQNGMAEPKPMTEWEEWYDAYWTKIEEEEAA